MALNACLALLVILVSVFFIYKKKKYSYWSDKGVIGPSPLPVVGNFGKVILQTQSANQCVKEVHLNFAGHKLVGLYRGFQPVILVRDPELIKHVLVKDFQIFQDRGMSVSRSKLSNNLFAADGETWKIMRQKLTPLFTSRKLKDMTPVIQMCVNRFINYVDHLVENNIEHEIRSLTGKYTLEVIGLCAFGLDLNTFTDEKNEFSIMAKKIFAPSLLVRITVVLDMIIPGIRKLFRTSTEIQDFFLALVQNVIKAREGKPLDRNDFMDLMIEMKEQGKVSRKLDDGVSEIEVDDFMIAAQALVFYSAGFDTSSATMSFLFHELALNPDIQELTYKNIG
jgi:cytochrome P450 family 6